MNHTPLLIEPIEDKNTNERNTQYASEFAPSSYRGTEAGEPIFEKDLNAKLDDLSSEPHKNQDEAAEIGTTKENMVPAIPT